MLTVTDSQVPTSDSENARRARTVLVTGSSGYIGGRLAPRLLELGYHVHCLVRDRRKIESRPWGVHPNLKIVEGDATDRSVVTLAMNGCSAAYYLIHSMIATPGTYRERDRQLAQTFALAAAAARIDRMIYLGGLGETGPGLSAHLSSRREVEASLGSGPVPVTVLRAAMIIGSGSASFEILRYLTERLPIMVTPRWVATECQPIAVSNVLNYLIKTLEVPDTVGRIYDIGGPDVLSYRKIMDITASALRLPRRIIIPVPVLSPRLSSLWIHLVTPIGREIARPLAEGLRNRVVCRNDDAVRAMPQELLSVSDALSLALVSTTSSDFESSWSDAGPVPGDADWAGGTTFVDERSTDLVASPSDVFKAVCGIGGVNGWHAADYLWRIRGALDRLAGGPGLRRGRRDPEAVRFGDALDFWRVTSVETNRRLDLRAEMKLPGEALLSFVITPSEGLRDSCRLTQTARFRPRGLLGLIYWYAILPFHGIVFRGMLEGLRREATKRADQTMQLGAEAGKVK